MAPRAGHRLFFFVDHTARPFGWSVSSAIVDHSELPSAAKEPLEN
jgi:hypothetical protein